MLARSADLLKTGVYEFLQLTLNVVEPYDDELKALR